EMPEPYSTARTTAIWIGAALRLQQNRDNPSLLQEARKEDRLSGKSPTRASWIPALVPGAFAVCFYKKCRQTKPLRLRCCLAVRPGLAAPQAWSSLPLPAFHPNPFRRKFWKVF